jgi:hypothetical protein
MPLLPSHAPLPQFLQLDNYVPAGDAANKASSWAGDLSAWLRRSWLPLVDADVAIYEQQLLQSSVANIAL